MLEQKLTEPLMPAKIRVQRDSLESRMVVLRMGLPIVASTRRRQMFERTD